jgi:hypothetical protein
LAVPARPAPDRRVRRPTQRIDRWFAVGSLVGAVVGLAAFAWLVTNGRADLAFREPLASFFDSQARALLEGRWDVPRSEVFIEGFRIDGKTYTYFGLWPTLLRMPVLAFGDEYYGRLTQLSMLLAVTVGLVGTTFLHWRIRSLVRPGRPGSLAEAVVAGAVTLTFACGTTVFFLGSRAWVYHEAILWGVAWSLPAYERLLAYITEPRPGRLVAASAFTALAFSSRPAAGLGPVVAIALVLLGQLLRALARWIRARGRDERSRPVRALRAIDWLGTADGRTSRRRTVGLAIALLVPIALYGWVNWSRFGTLFRVPWRQQALVALDLQHQRVLDANGGTYFGLKFGLTTMLQYLRPDAIGFDALFPFVTFPRFGTVVVGNADFDVLDWSTSVPASMPALTLLGLVGAWAILVRPRFAGTDAVRALRVPVIGAATGVVLVLAIAFVANRYLGDWVPLLALGSLTGLHVLLRRREDPAHRRRTTIALGAVAVAAVFGLWVNGSLAFLYQRLYNPHTEAARAGMLGVQYDVDEVVGGGPRSVTFVETLPPDAAGPGTSAVVGDCAALYWSDGREWFGVEGTPAGGWFRFRARAEELPVGGWMPVVSWGIQGNEDVVGLRRRGDLVHVAYGRPTRRGALQWHQSTDPLTVPDGQRFTLTVHVDQPRASVSAAIDGRSALRLDDVGRVAAGEFRAGRVTGRGGLSSRFAGELEPLPVRATLCERLLDRAGQAAGVSS